jgi:hypothetical protein
MIYLPQYRAAQHGAGADAAARPQDRGDLESWLLPDLISVYGCGAAKRQAVGQGEYERRGAERRFDVSFLMERPWCGRPVVPMSPQARGAECPLCQPVPRLVVRSVRQLQASPVRRRSQAAPVVQPESRAEGCSGEGLYHSIEALA